MLRSTTLQAEFTNNLLRRVDSAVPVSISQTSSWSPSASQTMSDSQSASWTASQLQTLSVTVTASLTTSQWTTATATQSPSLSCTQTLSLSQTKSASSTTTPSPTVTASLSMSRSQSWTRSPTFTSTSTQTQSGSKSRTSSTSATCTPSVTTTLTLSSSGTASSSQTQSQAASVSGSPTPTPSTLATPTSSTTASATSSQLHSVYSHTSSASTAATAPHSPLVLSLTSTRSPSSSVATQGLPQPLSFTVSESHSGSQAPTSTDTPSPSSSPRPISLEIFFRNESLVSAPTSFVVSDAFPSYSLTLELGSCPFSTADTGSVELSCTAALSAGSTSTLYSEVVQAGSTLSCRPSSDVSVPLPQVVFLGLYSLGGSSGRGTLTCEVSMGSVGLARASVPVIVSPARWPLWSDAIVVSTAGLMRSVVLGETVNVTSALLEAVCQDRVSCGGGEDFMAIALTSPSAVLEAVRTAWASYHLPPSAPDFSLTLVGQTLVVLRSSHFAFVNETTASVGIVSATVLNTSRDGEWLLLKTPLEADICDGVAANEDCGYFPLALSNPIVRAAPVTFAPAISCPPFCPGEVAIGSTVPLVVESSSGLRAIPAVLPTGANLGAARPVPLELPLLSSLGIYYARNCSAAGHWTDPTTGACYNASDPRSFACAYGSGDACTGCPGNAMCPGGNRKWCKGNTGSKGVTESNNSLRLLPAGVWPRPGAWAASETSGRVAVVSCLPPSGRCLGWNASAGVSQVWAIGSLATKYVSLRICT